MMRLTFDRNADAAYLYVGTLREGETVTETKGCFVDGVEAPIFIDFDREGMILGIEVLRASEVLSSETLASAEAPS